MQKEEKMKIFVFACIVCTALVGASLFPAHNLFQAILVQIVFFVFFPFLAIRFSLREHLQKNGLLFFSALTVKDFFKISFVFVLALGVFFLLFLFTPIHQYYFPPETLTKGFLYFLLYSILVDGVFSLIFTFFFQGFVLFFLERLFKSWTLVLQWLFFIFALSISGKLDWTMALQVYAALFSGFISLSTRSVPIAFFFTWLLVVFTEMLLLKFF